MVKKFKAVFDESNSDFYDTKDMNDFFLRCFFIHFGDFYYVKGYLLLSDIYKELDLPLTQEVISAGWHKKGVKDFDKDFDITYTYDEENNCYTITFCAEDDISKYFPEES